LYSESGVSVNFMSNSSEESKGLPSAVPTLLENSKSNIIRITNINEIFMSLVDEINSHI
jgi:hypothetical protein